MLRPTVLAPVVLCILDGWGVAPDSATNAVSRAYTPTFDYLRTNCPNAVLHADGGYVGLPDGQFGNSEVGHTNIGAGSIVRQSLTILNEAFETNSYQKNPALCRLLSTLHESGGKLHIVGLASKSGVHSHQSHMVALANFARESDLEVCLHLFTDGRDAPPASAPVFLSDLMPQLKGCKVASVMGRYFAMDRDQRWERIALAWRAIACGEAEDNAASANEMVKRNYERKIQDEFMPPCIIGDYAGMAAEDGLILTNFRSDRARQLLEALFDPNFKAFERKVAPCIRGATMTTNGALDSYCPPLFPPTYPETSLGKVVSESGLIQLRAAETEKYPHVTFFLNGGQESCFEGEERILVPSPKVATYDMAPEMSAQELTRRVVGRLHGKICAAGEPCRELHPPALTIINYANPDMVGHTGDLDAAIRACETTDKCLSDLLAATKSINGQLVVTADHGNAEVMWDEAQSCPHTAHTSNLVPIIVWGRAQSLRDGCLADIAPTVLDLLGVPQPKAMTGCSLLADNIS